MAYMKKDKFPYQSELYLYNELFIKKRTLQDVANEFNVTRQTISFYKVKYGIKGRGSSPGGYSSSKKWSFSNRNKREFLNKNKLGPIKNLKNIEFLPGRWRRFKYNPFQERMPIGLNFSGVYAFFIDGNLKYIGKANNIQKRLFSYTSDFKTFCSPFSEVYIAVRKCRDMTILSNENSEIEKSLIKRLKPVGNNTSNNLNIKEKRKKAEKLYSMEKQNAISNG